MLRAASMWLVAFVMAGVPAGAQTVLTFEEVVARARARAGTVAVARARVAEAEAGVVEASVRLREDPLLEVNAGPRFATETRHTELEVAVFQPFETGGQRRARITGAAAAVDRRMAEVSDAVQDAVLDAAATFLDALASVERVRLTEEADEVTRELLRAAERRYAAGDIAAIDLNLVRVEAARSGAALRGARAELSGMLGTLRGLLRLPAGAIEVRGSLEPAPLPPIERLVAQLDDRPEFSALAAEVREADAEAQLGRAMARSDVGLRLGYAREEGDTTVLAGFTVSLPASGRGRGTLAAGLARGSRARLELEVARDRALTDLRTAYALHGERAALADALSRDAAPGLADNEALARRSYEAGEMNLMSLLLLRRDALDTQFLIVTHRLEAARSRLQVDSLAGVLR